MRLIIIGILFGIFSISLAEEKVLKKPEEILLDRLAKEAKENIKKEYRLRLLEEVPDKPWVTRPFRALLKRGSKIYQPKTKSVFEVKSDYYLLVKLAGKESKTAYILDYQGNIKFVVLAKYLLDVETELDLYPQENHNLVYSKPEEKFSTNKSFRLHNSLGVHWEFLDGNYFSDTFGGENRKATANQILYRGYYDWGPSIDFGLTLGYEYGEWEDRDEQFSRVTWSNLTYGPTIVWKFLSGFQGAFYLHLSARKTIFHRAAFEEDRYKFSTTTYAIDLERSLLTDYGEYFFGIGFKNYRSKITDETEPTPVFTPKQETNAITFSIGIKKDLIF